MPNHNMSISTRQTNDIAAQAELLEPPGSTSLRLLFSGPFQGEIVIWDATFISLATRQAGEKPDDLRRNFIDIGDHTAHGIALTVGLNVACFDLPTIRKAMLMVRQYKRLARGRYEFGPPIPPA